MLSSRIEFPPDDVSILIDVLIVIAISDPVIGWSIGYPDVQYLIGRRSLLVLLEYWVLWCQRVYKALALILLVRWANICKCKNRESFISKVLVVWLMENFVIVFDILGYGLFIWFRIYYQRLGGKKLVLSTSFGCLKGFHDGELKKITYLLSQKMGITNLFLGRNFQYYIIYYTILLYLH